VLKWLGVLIFVAGAAGVALTPLLSIFSPAFAFLSIFAIVLGVVLIFSVLIYERYCEWKRMHEEFSEEDLRP